MEGQQDRISFSMGLKVNLGNYESADFHISFSSDLKEGETPKGALKRISKFVEESLEAKAKEYISKREEVSEEW
jgi:hypothetical protein